MDNYPVFTREVRRLMRSRMCWAFTLLIALGSLTGRAASPDELGIWASVLPAMLALYWAQRSVRAELEEETIEMLGTLPLSPFKILLEIGSGSAAAALAFASVGLLIACYTPDRLGRALPFFLPGAAVTVALAWFGALGSFQYGGTFVSSSGAGCVLGAVIAGMLAGISTALAVLPIYTAIPVVLTLGYVGAVLAYLFWRATGGQWVESLLHAPQAPATPGRSLDPEAPEVEPMLTPDWASPLLWFELKQSGSRIALWTSVVAALLLVTRLCSGAFHDEATGIVLGPAMTLGTLALMLTTAGATAERRRVGMWAELAVTPQPARAILHGMLAGRLVPAIGGLIALVLVMGLCQRGPLRIETLIMLPSTLGLWLLAALFGFLAGSITTGWKAGFMALAMAYGTGALVTVANAFVVCNLHSPNGMGFSIWLLTTVLQWFAVAAALYAICLRRVRAAAC